MQKIFGIVVIGAMVWGAVEVMTKGDQAFGGLLADSNSAGSEASEARPWAGERAGNKLVNAHRDRGDAIDRLSGE